MTPQPHLSPIPPSLPDSGGPTSIHVAMTESETDPSAESFDDLRARAESGEAEAQFNLGLMYVAGVGVEQDDTAAGRWFRLAAGQGHTLAQHNLGRRPTPVTMHR